MGLIQPSLDLQVLQRVSWEIGSELWPPCPQLLTMQSPVCKQMTEDALPWSTQKASLPNQRGSKVKYYRMQP